MCEHRCNSCTCGGHSPQIIGKFMAVIEGPGGEIQTITTGVRQVVIDTSTLPESLQKEMRQLGNLAIQLANGEKRLPQARQELTEVSATIERNNTLLRGALWEAYPDKMGEDLELRENSQLFSKQGNYLCTPTPAETEKIRAIMTAITSDREKLSELRHEIEKLERQAKNMPRVFEARREQFTENLAAVPEFYNKYGQSPIVVYQNDQDQFELVTWEHFQEEGTTLSPAIQNLLEAIQALKAENTPQLDQPETPQALEETNPSDGQTQGEAPASEQPTDEAGVAQEP